MNRRAILVAMAIASLWIAAPPAAAHPLGNFTVNRYAEVVVAPGRVTVGYALDLAEVPAYQVLRDVGHDPEALQRWADRTAESIAEGCDLRVDGRRVSLTAGTATAATRPGQGGLATLRLDVTLSGRFTTRSGILTFHDRNDPRRLGWREISARGADGVRLVGSSVPAVSVTQGLRVYPQDLLTSPLAVTTLRTRFRPGPSAEPTMRDPAAVVVAPATGALAAVLDRHGLLLVVGLLIAAAIGAWHALLPGHGKTLMAATAVGARTRSRDAVGAACSVAAMHTVSVIALAAAVVVIQRSFPTESVYPWLRVVSGVAAIAVGVHLIRRRWESFAAGRSNATNGVTPQRSDHHHDHRHEPVERLLSRRGLLTLAVAGGILPSPSALLVLLGALQRGRAVYGLSLVLSFSLGMAASLAAVGLGATHARRVFGRVGIAGGRTIALAAALAVVVLGGVVAATGLESL